MIVYPVVFISLAVFLAIPLQAKHLSRRPRLRQNEFKRFRLPSRITTPSGSFLDKLKRVKSFQDLYREFRIPKSQQVPVRKKPIKPGVKPLISGVHPLGSKPGITISVPEVDISHRATYCQKRKVCVELPQPRDKSGIHWPYCASVPRCSGCCSTVSNIQICTAVRTSTRRVDVFYVPYDTSMPPRPNQVNVMVHDQCQCRCRQSASSCNANQVFVVKHCRCECNPKVSTTCRPKFKWDRSSCMCACKHPPFSCPRNQRYSKSTCGCVCRPRSCLRGYYFDLQSCACLVRRAIKALPFKLHFKWPLPVGRKHLQRPRQLQKRQQ